jgi:uncharacterized protein YndB with AHSA1/START domain
MNDVALQSRTQQIVVDEVFPHAPETIWKTLTSGGLMGRWLRMAPSGFDAVLGNRFTYQTTPAGEWDGIIHCEVLDVVPNERFVYSWVGGHESNDDAYGSKLDTKVSFTLEKVAGGTRLRLVHSGFVTPRNDSAYRGMSGGWMQVVPAIGAIAGEQEQSNAG